MCSPAYRTYDSGEPWTFAIGLHRDRRNMSAWGRRVETRSVPVVARRAPVRAHPLYLPIFLSEYFLHSPGELEARLYLRGDLPGVIATGSTKWLSRM